MSDFYRGELYYVEPYQTTGSEQRAGRPAIIVSNDMNNNYSGTVEVVYLTTQPKNDLPTHVTIRSTGRLSTALCEQITSVSKDRLGERICELTSDELRQIDIALSVSLAIMDIEPPAEKPPEPEKEPSPTNTPLPAPTPAPVQPSTCPDEVQHAAYIKVSAERDIYKQLYESLLARALPAAAGK
ncbi:type II toxin-antitoxin system PemK/MazF family toxin [Clostridium sp. D33t1_170424_F3]|uniref:type II toxin-antitoxin system PemK/MazF family toxin n=1 Tax=Clostridium sp. D33t1_170424_F3 TaxID=2787099 RepID=UPI0018A9B027|nr:type II toxin-antitoxin system PemK/MazF family toxin [Clostridium sp. D33t1_170424_F3]